MGLTNKNIDLILNEMDKTKSIVEKEVADENQLPLFLSEGTENSSLSDYTIEQLKEELEEENDIVFNI